LNNTVVIKYVIKEAIKIDLLNIIQILSTYLLLGRKKLVLCNDVYISIKDTLLFVFYKTLYMQFYNIITVFYFL